MAQQQKKTARKRCIREARVLYGSDDIVIEDSAAVLDCGGLGTWVQAWVWVPKEET